MTSETFYVPLLRHKQAEWTALNNTSPIIRERLVPILEIVPEAFERRPKVAERAGLDTAVLAVRDLWDRMHRELERGRLFLDAHLLRDVPMMKRRTSSSLFDALSLIGRMDGTVPVAHLDSTDSECAAIAAFASLHATGAAIRCSGTQVVAGGAASLEKLARRIKVATSDIDVIVDLARDPFFAGYKELLDGLGGRRTWRSWTVLAGVFPRDLSSFSPLDYTHEIARQEWTRWHEQVRLLRSADRPNFGDYTVQHGVYIPQVKLEGSQSVRYTLKGSWRILRGRKASIYKKTGGVGFQYHAHARYLTTTPEYYGSAFSWGDSEIALRAATPSASPGGAPQWISFCISHHLAVAATDVAVA